MKNKFMGYTAVVHLYGCCPEAKNFMYYNDALEFLKEIISFRQPYQKAVGCIMNGKLDNVCFTMEEGPDESKH